MILVVNADKTPRHFLISMIKDQLDQPAIGADNAHNMVWHLKKIFFNLILIQDNLKDANCFELITKIRNTHSRFELPIILLAPNGDTETILKGFKVGVNDCITLPFDPKIAMARIHNQLFTSQEFQVTMSKAVSTSTATISPEKEGTLSGTTANGELHTEPDATEKTKSLPDAGVAQPAEAGSPLETIYRSGSEMNRPIPCEMPLSLFIGTRSFFCKTIWISQHDILLLTFEDFTKEPEYHLQLLHPAGGTVDIKVTETQRKPIQDRGAGVLKLNLKIIKAPKEFDDLYRLFHCAFQADGMAGLKAVLRGEDVKSSPAKVNLPQEETTPDPTMVAFSTAASSLNVIKGTRYKYEKEVGKGGFASVFLVRDNALKRPVAMKVLNRDFSKLAEARTSFLGEAQIAAQFHHPNIVFVFEVGELFESQYKKYLDFPKEILIAHPERLIYFTMQYVEGQTLSKWIRSRKKRPEDDCLDVMIKIVNALVFAHGKGVIHRDIKPDNIMITPEGHVLVTDFGIATLARREEPEKKKGKKGKVEVACTPKYASPEQLRGKTLDGRSDMYSFGVLAYEMLTGMAPFKGKSLSDIVEKQIKAPPLAISKKRMDIDSRLEKIITRCLAKKPEDRFLDSEQLLKALIKLKGATTAPVKRSPMETLEELLSQVILVKTSIDAARIIEQLTAFLHLQKTYDNVEQIAEIKHKLTDSSLLNILIEKNLSNENQQLLYEFFMALDSNRAVLKILQWFRKEKEPWKKLVLGELAVLSAGRELIPLATFGLELNDADANILLKGFGEIAPQCQEPVFFKWAQHSGFKTQKELLKIISIANRPDSEEIRILEYFAHAGGTRHKVIRDMALRLLGERQKTRF